MFKGKLVIPLKHRWGAVYRLIHRRKLHLLQFAFSLKLNVTLLDNRDILTRRRDGILFKLPKCNHYRFPRNPYYRCMSEWNSLSVEVSLFRIEIHLRKK